MAGFLIVYDIFNKKRLRKIKKIVYSYRVEGQKSAIESPLTKSHLKTLISELNYFSDEKDKINIIYVEQNPICLGKATSLELENNAFIIV